MVGTIGSVGHGATGEVKKAWQRLFLAYVLGSAAGGLVLGLFPALGGLVLDATERLLRMPRTYADVTGVLLLVLMGLHDLGWLSFRLPSRRRQVPMGWKQLPGYWSPFVFGFALGTGVLTTVYLASFYAVAVLAVLLRDPVASILLAVTYAVGRAVLILISAHVHADPEELVAALGARPSVVARLNGLLTLAAAVALGVFAR